MRSEKWDVGSVKLGQALRSLALKSTPHTSHLSHHNNKLQSRKEGYNKNFKKSNKNRKKYCILLYIYIILKIFDKYFLI